MKRNTYETLIILDSNHYARDPGGVGGAADKMLGELDGNVLVSRLWNEQKLAYPVEGHNKGTYWLIYHELDSNKLDEFNRMCQLNDSILRQLTLKLDSRLVEPMVAHAKGQTTSEASKDVESVAT